MKVINKYWDSDLCLTKIKVNEKLKTIGFDGLSWFILITNEQ